MDQEWYAACPRGLEALLRAELETLGAGQLRERVAGVEFQAPLSVAYRACLWSRLANRILKPLGSFAAADGDQLYKALQGIDWGQFIDASQSIAINFSGTNRGIRNTQFGTQRAKDAIVDWFSQRHGRRPSVERERPDLRLSMRLNRDQLDVAVDFSGGSLHQRGYRRRAGAAPLKENLAAAILLRADWPGMAARGGALIDPMCGSATLLVEGAMMAADIAPGLGRRRFGFESLKDFNGPQWQAILTDAESRAKRGRAAQLPEMRGYDADPRVIGRAQENIAACGLQQAVRVSVKPLAELVKPTHRPLPDGLIICNPPYGERLGEKESLHYLYRELGEVMAREFPDWEAAILTSDLELGRATGLRSHKRYALYNGALETFLLLFRLAGNELRDSRPPVAETLTAAPTELSEGAAMFANRLRKNRRRLAAWVKREGIECYRLYDADMPEYAVAVDLYGEAVHVAEYQAPKGIDPQAAARRLEEVLQALPTVLDVAAKDVAVKTRSRQRGTAQYQKQGSEGELLSVREGGARLLVNLRDYLDTGLFLDHRPLRLRIGREARGKDFLNLFCYTGTASVHAALGGARSTTSVDMSRTYLDWLRRNLAHNGLGEATHRLHQADCLRWLEEADTRFDLILLDPPSFSNSKRMEGSFDVQRDHPGLVRGAMARLRPGGRLYFSNNRRGFRMDEALLAEYDCRDISRETLDPDFARNPRIHCCWQLAHRTPDGGSKD